MNMKTLLNLLPEEKKDAIQRHLRSRFLLWQLFLLFLLQIFYLAILICTYLILDYQLRNLGVTERDMTIAAQEEVERLGTYEKKFDTINKQVEVIGAIDRSHMYFSRVFVLIDPLLPDGITVMNLTTKEYMVSLFGRAETREQLLQLDENLKGAGHCFQKVAIPLQNLFSQENIDFQVDFTLEPECLRRDKI
jgi:hypothetical protein